MTIERFSDLEVYQEALELAVEIHRRLEQFPTAETDRIIDQLRRSSAAIGAHVAEGWGRKASVADFRRYLRMALGEIQETKYWLEFSTRLGLLNEAEGRRWWTRYDRLGARTYRLIDNWQRFDDEHRGAGCH